MLQLVTLFVTIVTALTGAAADLTGTWEMQVQHDPNIPMALVLAQDGTSLKATLTTPHDEKISLAGAIEGSGFKLSTAADTRGTELAISGTLKDDGTLDGVLTGSMGQLRWTAERLKGEGR